MSDLPEPPVGQEVDLKNYPFTPIFRARLFGSEFHANATDAEWRAGVTLWLKSWDQMPAGSLPKEDVALCRLAELGRDMTSWREVKANALHGWYECSDGRLYHKVVAEGVNKAWQSKEANRDRTEAARVARAEKRKSQNQQHTGECSVTEDVTTPVTASNINEKREIEGSANADPDAGARADALPTPSYSSVFALWWFECPNKVARRAAFQAYGAALKRGATPDQLIDGLRRYIRTKPPDRQWAHPSTWLNGDRWLDQPAEVTTRGEHGQSAAANLYEGAFRAAEAFENRIATEGGGGGGESTVVPLLDRRRPAVGAAGAD